MIVTVTTQIPFVQIIDARDPEFNDTLILVAATVDLICIISLTHRGTVVHS